MPISQKHRYLPLLRAVYHSHLETRFPRLSNMEGGSDVHNTIVSPLRGKQFNPSQAKDLGNARPPTRLPTKGSRIYTSAKGEKCLRYKRRTAVPPFSSCLNLSSVLTCVMYLSSTRFSLSLSPPPPPPPLSLCRLRISFFLLLGFCSLGFGISSLSLSLCLVRLPCQRKKRTYCGYCISNYRGRPLLGKGDRRRRKSKKQ